MRGEEPTALETALVQRAIEAAGSQKAFGRHVAGFLIENEQGNGRSLAAITQQARTLSQGKAVTEPGKTQILAAARELVGPPSPIEAAGLTVQEAAEAQEYVESLPAEPVTLREALREVPPPEPEQPRPDEIVELAIEVAHARDEVDAAEARLWDAIDKLEAKLEPLKMDLHDE